MNTTIYRQNDPRWASLPYPRKPYTVATDGCGLCAVTHCAIERTEYYHDTPQKFYEFMKDYATDGDGTEWAGIDAGLDKYIGNHKRHYNMASLWAELDQGNRVGVILFGKGTAPDGTQWTGGGHYVAFVDYKKEGGRHYLYTKDSNGARKLDGWHCYETSMAGCIPDVLWSAVLPGWKHKGGAWYYYNTEGAILKNTWLKDGKNIWYYLKADGKMAANEWIKDKGSWYFLKESGKMAANEWAKDTRGWCYLGKNGKQMKDAWIRYKNNFYYIKPDGYMAAAEEMPAPCKFGKEGKLVANE